jgi:hypothetical protein
VIEYPKIETLYDRDEKTHKVIPGKLRLPEFALVSRWLVTEKVDGTNLRIWLRADGAVKYGGRTDAAQLPATIVDWLQTHLPAERFAGIFEAGAQAILFGEGYGPKIQKGGGLYRADVSFRLFDVALIPPERASWWWLARANVEDVAAKLGIATVPVLAVDAPLESALGFVSCASQVAELDGGAGCTHEGIVARTDPLLFTQKGARLMFKLKGRDL